MPPRPNKAVHLSILEYFAQEDCGTIIQDHSRGSESKESTFRTYVAMRLIGEGQLPRAREELDIAVALSGDYWEHIVAWTLQSVLADKAWVAMAVNDQPL